MADGLTGPAIKYGFEQLGHTVRAVDPRLKLEKTFRVACEFRPDLVFCSRESMLAGLVRQIRQEMEVIACMWNVDTWSDVNHWGGLYPLIEACDYYFVVASKLIPEWREINRNTFWLPEGLQVETHDKPKRITEEDKVKYSCDVCWIGGRDRVQAFREPFLNAIERMGINFKQWGCMGNPQIRGVEHDKAVALSKINIALSGCPQNGKYTSQRNYIILGAAGFLLELDREKWSDLYEIFPSEILDSYGSPSELVEKIHYWLDHEKERREFAERGYKWVRENATFTHRVKMALDYMGLR
jgi:hypothetical protein